MVTILQERKPYNFNKIALHDTRFLVFYYISSSTIRLRPIGLFLPPGNHLPISLVVFLYFFSPFRFVIFCLGSLLSSILCICSLQFILYSVNLSLILKIRNCSLMSLLLFFFAQKCISCRWS